MNTFSEIFLALAPNPRKETVRLLLDKLVERYNEPHRRYHNLDHVETGLKTYFELYSEPLSRVDFFTWAYHDAVYDSKASDNEQKSADLFMWDAQTLGLTTEETDQVIKAILSTNLSGEPVGVINDIDLSGLGAPPDVYQQNTKNIREEYSWVEPEVWRVGRSAVLRQLLKRPTLYVTMPFIEKFTDQAIKNMTQELQELGIK